MQFGLVSGLRLALQRFAGLRLRVGRTERAVGRTRAGPPWLAGPRRSLSDIRAEACRQGTAKSFGFERSRFLGVAVDHLGAEEVG